MNRGTRSILFGTHQFLLHPLAVTIAWRHLNGRWPGWRELVCIFIHDWGYWGCKTMDGKDGEVHPYFAANLAEKMFGRKYRDLVLFHSRHVAKIHGREPSLLCWADKMSMAFESWWLYIGRGLLTGELREYYLNCIDCDIIKEGDGYINWFFKMRDCMVWMAITKDGGSMPYCTHSTRTKK